MRAPVGPKIRRRRKEMGLSQAGLAAAAGISASYLNLIEADRREVGGALLNRIAAGLGLPPEDLSGAREQKLVQRLEEVMGDPLLAGLNPPAGDLRDLVARYPELAQALLRLHRAQAEAGAELDYLSDRFSSDPVLAAMLHEALNRMTGLRSGAEILAEVPDLSEAERARFSGSIMQEARGLSQTMRGLAGYFEQSRLRRSSLSPVREVEDGFIAANNYFPELEAAAEQIRADLEGRTDEAHLAEVLERRHGLRCRRTGDAGAQRVRREGGTLWLRSSDPQATRRFQLARQIVSLAQGEVLDRIGAGLGTGTEEAGRLARSALASYVAGAMVMPYDAYLDAAERHRYDIDLLSHSFGASFEQAAHRLVTLRRPGAEGVPFGFLRADPSGRLTKRFPVHGLSWPGGGHGCPIWPVYLAPAAPDVVRQVAEFPNGHRYLLIAKAVPKRIASWRDPPLTFSIMLACDLLQADRTVYGSDLKISDATPAVPVGPSCALCPRAACSHRQEAATLSAAS